MIHCHHFSCKVRRAPRRAADRSWHTMPLLLPLLLLCCSGGALALVPKTPVPLLGFSTWNHFRGNIDEHSMRAVADSMVASGLVRAGYTYLNIDDLWAANDRNAKGEIVEDKVKFPSGMLALANYLEARGMHLGLYTARNTRTCSGKMPGSLGNEAIDAQTFAAMGAKFVKNDDCGVIYADAAKDYGAMERAIAAVPNVTMIHSVKAPDLRPADAPHVCQFRRVAKDLKDTWEDIVRLLDTANDEEFLSIVGPGFFSDLDMLEVGNPEKGAVCRVEFTGQVCGGLSQDEQIAHMSLWAAFKSPLVIGADPRHLSKATMDILTAPEVLAVSQDPLATSVRLVSAGWSREARRKQLRAGAAVPAAQRGAACVGYIVSGAGSADADGCYVLAGKQKDVWTKDATHTIYSWEGLWHLGHTGVSVLYTTDGKAASPPESQGGCGSIWKAVKGDAPCPAIKRSGLPPAPPPAPPAPPAPTPTPQGDMAAAGIKLKMSACDVNDPTQHFECFNATAGSCGATPGNGPCITIQAGGGPYKGLCATTLTDRWPWWVSLLPCNATDGRQFWRSSGVSASSMQLIANTGATKSVSQSPERARALPECLFVPLFDDDCTTCQCSA